MDSKDFYFHSIISDESTSLKIFSNILNDGKILSLNRTGLKFDHIRMNLDDEICLSRKIEPVSYYDAYSMFVRRKLSFIIRGDLENVYHPQMIVERTSYRDDKKYIRSGFTDLKDEYRIKDEISLDDVVGINFPVKSSILKNRIGYKSFFFDSYDYVSSKKALDQVKRYYEQLLKVIDQANVSLPIYDIEENIEIKSDADFQKLKKKKLLRANKS